MQKNFTLSVLNIIQPKKEVKNMKNKFHITSLLLFYALVGAAPHTKVASTLATSVSPYLALRLSL